MGAFHGESRQRDRSNNPYFNYQGQNQNLLLESRRIFLSDAVDSDTSNAIIRKLWYLELQNPGKPIFLSSIAQAGLSMRVLRSGIRSK